MRLYPICLLLVLTVAQNDIAEIVEGIVYGIDSISSTLTSCASDPGSLVTDFTNAVNSIESSIKNDVEDEFETGLTSLG